MNTLSRLGACLTLSTAVLFPSRAFPQSASDACGQAGGNCLPDIQRQRELSQPPSAQARAEVKNAWYSAVAKKYGLDLVPGNNATSDPDSFVFSGTFGNGMYRLPPGVKIPMALVKKPAEAAAALEKMLMTMGLTPTNYESAPAPAPPSAHVAPVPAKTDTASMPVTLAVPPKLADPTPTSTVSNQLQVLYGAVGEDPISAKAAFTQFRKDCSKIVIDIEDKVVCVPDGSLCNELTRNPRDHWRYLKPNEAFIRFIPTTFKDLTINFYDRGVDPNAPNSKYEALIIKGCRFFGTRVGVN